jgi:hypothetical protein
MVFLAFHFIVNFQRDDKEDRFVLDQHAELDFYSASSLKLQSADKHVAPLGHIILIPSQPVFTHIHDGLNNKQGMFMYTHILVH